MSLISQNALPISKGNKAKRDNIDEPVSEDADDIESEIDILRNKKRKKARKEEVESQDGMDKGSDLFFVDHSGNNVLSVYEEDVELLEEINRLRKLRKEEDESLVSGSEYVARLRAQHAKLNPGTEWAQLDVRARGDRYYDDDSSEEEDGAVLAHGYQDVDELLRRNEDVVVKSSVKLLPGLLECSRLIDANAQEPCNGPINSVQFHRNAQLLLAAGLDRKLRFFQIDGKRNTKIQSIFLDDCPVPLLVGRKKLGSFEVSPDSSTIAFVGNEGYILLVSAKSKELIGTLKMNGTARSLAFTDDGKQLLSFGGMGRKPMKTIENLTTKVDFLKFNNDAQILAICSSMKKNSMKLVHVPSFTVFSNWPPANKTLHYPRCLDFSPGGGFMAIGNAAGTVLLYKLHHYNHA
ncbi:hypothetical protein FNV43_RR23307 [Rhamnella rubrinervis]|uniref:Uncharacterized protein n=1 Tax=Rhamnella rubrinervis TaxID=2594499 RepID=A0A8K0DYN4_9ROSA|nr:hypothetical protein FNV43_RR23307 [Rhamnella rubrinervis]